ncbi:hypothetical protein HK102_004912 [Quaeritorhiza haematococci]|nr:hypothetical protein HK102_004912 [Quaeritorhiza haematococci]
MASPLTPFVRVTRFSTFNSVYGAVGRWTPAAFSQGTNSSRARWRYQAVYTPAAQIPLQLIPVGDSAPIFNPADTLEAVSKQFKTWVFAFVHPPVEKGTTVAAMGAQADAITGATAAIGVPPTMMRTWIDKATHRFLLPPPYRNAIDSFKFLRERTESLSARLLANVPIDSEVLAEYNLLMQQTADIVLGSGHGLPDPSWGLDPNEGYITEDECRQFMIEELSEMAKKLGTITYSLRGVAIQKTLNL